MPRNIDEPAVDALWNLRSRLWIGAVLFFAVGDVATTVVGLGFGPFVEAGPVVGPLIDRYGYAAMVALKVAMLGGCYVLYRLVPRPHSAGVPLGLATLGVLVTGWNLALMAVVLVL